MPIFRQGAAELGKKKETMGLFEAIARAQQKKQVTGIAIPAWMQKKGLAPKNHTQAQSAESHPANGGTATAEPPVQQAQPQPTQPPETAKQQEPLLKSAETSQPPQRVHKSLLSDLEEASPAQKEHEAKPKSKLQPTAPEPQTPPKQPASPAPQQAVQPVPPAATRTEPAFQAHDRDILRPKVATQPALKIIGSKVHLAVSGGVCLITAVSAVLALVLVFLLGWVLGGRSATNAALPATQPTPANVKPISHTPAEIATPSNRIGGRFYLVFKVLPGKTDHDKAEAQKIVDSLRRKGESASVEELNNKSGKSLYGVIGFASFESEDSAKAKDYLKKLKSSGIDYLVKSGANGSNVPVYIQWPEGDKQ